MIEVKSQIDIQPAEGSTFHSLRNFERVGGNRSITTAKVIALGEIHGDHNHVEIIGEFIRKFARKGDIVLLEGVGRDKEVFKGESSTHERYQLPTSVRAIGWDNLELHARVTNMYKENFAIYGQMKAAKDSKDYELFDTLYEMHQELNNEINDVGLRQRNISLKNQLRLIHLFYPNNRIFIIGGRRHFTQDPTLIKEFQKYPYIILQPNTADMTTSELFQLARKRFAGKK